MRQLFVSYSSHDSALVCALAGQLTGSFDRVFRYEDYEKSGNILSQMSDELQRSSHVVLIIGTKTASSEFQLKEAQDALNHGKEIVIVRLPDAAGGTCTLPMRFGPGFEAIKQLRLEARLPLRPFEIAQKLCSLFGIAWAARTGLPFGRNMLNYEKDVIEVYARLERAKGDLADPSMADIRRLIDLGLPPQWPAVAQVSHEGEAMANPLIPRIGNSRSRDAMVAVSALRVADGTAAMPLLLPEAGPRRDLVLSSNNRRFKVAIVVVGGIAPGINAVIDGIVSRHWLYAEKCGYAMHLHVHGMVNGPHAFFDEDAVVNLVANGTQLTEERHRLETASHAHEGGSIIGTSRDDGLITDWLPDGDLEYIVEKLVEYRVLYVIGGDGGMRFAHAIRTISREPKFMDRRRRERTGELSVVGIPKTMDNDILWVWQAFGFMSAVEKAREVVEHMHAEISSNPRLGIVQLFGSVSGFVVSHAILAGSAPMCDVALVPEVPFSLRRVADHLRQRLQARGSAPSGLVVMAETALPVDAEVVIQLVEDRQAREAPQTPPLLTPAERQAMDAFIEQRRAGLTMTGHTSDELRSACLKVVARGLEAMLKPESKDLPPSARHDPWQRFRVVTNEPRHIIRAIPPSSQDIIVGRRLGTLAVDNAVAGYTDFMISQWLTEFVLVPLPLVVLGRKQIHRDGIFWKSVLSKTDSFGVYS